ncbi:MAG TPA: CpsD/CapB family tyrosine-protein kinase [Steroidobacteraceae bacterium]|jgi:Mrp family chromosome partitioning ATPase
MDRIRKALDLARLERAKPPAEGNLGEEPIVVAPKASGVNGAVAAPLTAIVYTRTRVFLPSPAVLEANRVMNPGTAEPGAVAFRMLRTQVVQRMDANNWRSLAIFSPGDRDGKTTTAINLAVSLASDRRHTVLLVDFDFKRPSVAGRLGLSPQSGADDVLAGAASVEEALYHPDGFERLIILPARSAHMNSSEILAGPRSREVVAELRNRYPERIVIFDLPPVLHADDALAFAPLVECGLVVAAEGRTRRNDLIRTIELLHKTPLVGTVLNCATDAPRGY